jgi:hypothetical protein
MKSILYISILEGIYLIYMFRFFKTTINFDIHKKYFANKYLNHSLSNTYGLKICQFGQDFIVVLISILLFRIVYKIPQTYIYYSLYIALGLSFLMNWNAFVYILPVYVMEKVIETL